MAQGSRTQFNKSLRVLVVEDNQVDRRVLESMLMNSKGMTSLLKIADSMGDAMKFLKEYEFDIVILDLNLPDIQGKETLRQLNDGYPELAIVINTGAYEYELGLGTLSGGAQDFLVKGEYTSYILNKVLHYALERKHLEMELKDAYGQLKAAQSKLIQAEKMEVIGQLASGVAHEVKNPLATILYGVTYLDKYLEGKSEKVDIVLKNIKEATKRANVIITDLLDFSGLRKLKRKKCSLNDVIKKSLSLTSYELETKGIDVCTELSKDLMCVEIDINRIQQVLLNLVLNAGHAMADGGKLIIKTHGHVIEKGDDYLEYEYFNLGDTIVLLIIEDTGCGIPDDKLNKIFDPFFTSRRAKGGVGLGLSVTKNIMDMHEGVITIKNRSDDQSGVRATLIFKVKK